MRLPAHPPGFELTVRPSVQQLIILTVSHCVAIAALSVSLSCLPLLATVFITTLHYLRRLQHSGWPIPLQQPLSRNKLMDKFFTAVIVKKIKFHANQWEIATQTINSSHYHSQDRWSQAQLIHCALCTPYLTIITLSCNKKRYKTILFCDSEDSAMLRILRIHLRYYLKVL